MFHLLFETNNKASASASASKTLYDNEMMIGGALLNKITNNKRYNGKIMNLSNMSGSNQINQGSAGYLIESDLIGKIESFWYNSKLMRTNHEKLSPWSHLVHIKEGETPPTGYEPMMNSKTILSKEVDEIPQFLPLVFIESSYTPLPTEEETRLKKKPKKENPAFIIGYNNILDKFIKVKFGSYTKWLPYRWSLYALIANYEKAVLEEIWSKDDLELMIKQNSILHRLLRFVKLKVGQPVIATSWMPGYKKSKDRPCPSSIDYKKWKPNEDVNLKSEQILMECDTNDGVIEFNLAMSETVLRDALEIAFHSCLPFNADGTFGDRINTLITPFWGITCPNYHKKGEDNGGNGNGNGKVRTFNQIFNAELDDDPLEDQGITMETVKRVMSYEISDYKNIQVLPPIEQEQEQEQEQIS